MAVTRSQLNDALNNYISLPTKKRDVMSPHVQRSAKQALREFLIRYPYEEFPAGTEMLVLVKNWIAQSGWTQIKKHKIIRLFLAIIADQYIVDKAAATELVRKFKPHSNHNWSEKALNDYQLGTLFTKMYEHKSRYSDLRSATALAFMLYTGSRIAAALSAKDYRIDEDCLSATITRQKSRIIEDIPKSIPLSIVMPNGVELRQLVEEYIAQREKRFTPGGYLFPQGGGKSLSENTVRAYIRKLNLPFHLTPHKLRHTAGTIVAERVGILEATRLLDHSSIAITQLYVKKYTGDSRESISKAWGAVPVETQPALTVPTAEAKTAIKTIRKSIYTP
jgi:integrase